MSGSTRVIGRTGALRKKQMGSGMTLTNSVGQVDGVVKNRRELELLFPTG